MVASLWRLVNVSPRLPLFELQMLHAPLCSLVSVTNCVPEDCEAFDRVESEQKQRNWLQMDKSKWYAL